MQLNSEQDNFFIGFLIGALVPIAGYWLISELFTFLTSMGIMDEVSLSTGGQRLRTTLLLAIACNIIPSQFYVKRRSNHAIRGVVTATLIYAAFWLYQFSGVLLNQF